MTSRFCSHRTTSITRRDALRMGSAGFGYLAFAGLLALAVLDGWTQTVRDSLSTLNKHPAGRPRLVAYFNWSSKQREVYFAHGCPIAKLSEEILREEPAESESQIKSPYVPILDWLTEEFLICGFDPVEAKARARFMLSVSQGSIHVGHVLSDRSVFKAMRQLMTDWLEEDA